MLGIDVYASYGTFKALTENFNHGRANGKTFMLTQMRKNTVQEMKTYKIGSYSVTAFGVKHDALEPLGFLIEHPECGTILFATDTYYIPYSFKDFEIHHVMIECNFSKEILRQNNQLVKLQDRIMQSHFELQDVKEFFVANQFAELRDVILLHLSNANSNAEQFTEEIRTLTKRPVYIADKGLEVDFDLYKF
jgi:phosphoribosyl 1,2-cyclic phosphodiesterase